MSQPKFLALSHKERTWIAEHLEAVRELVGSMSPDDAGKPVTLDALDRAYAAWLGVASDNNDEVNAVINGVGIQFGQILVDQAGFAWTIAKDANGTDLAVRALPGRGDVLMYPANFVAKRWARKESNFFAASFTMIRTSVAEVAAKASVAPRRPSWRFWD